MKGIFKALFPAAAALFCWVTSGCAPCWPSRISASPAYRPSNFYRASQKLAPQIRRVAILPISVEQAEAGRLELEPVLYAELGKARAFEWVVVPPAQLREWTSKGWWSAEETLPADFFEHLQDSFGCDAVLFSHLRPYHAYKPLVIGWNLKLVAAQAKSVLWCADEVFDASAPSVAKAAENYCRRKGGPGLDAGDVLLSPRRFSQYALNALLTTLPER